ncbi:MAG: putative membrane protein (DUF2254) [Methanolobus sp. T82-4]|nr:MAG: putative membrane protein (DUF2254) [Methanolobus sp. T82-4]
MLPEKWKEYLDKPLWPNRLAYYLIIFIAVLSVFGIVILIFESLFSDFSILSNTAYNQYNTTQLSDMGFFDNERYLLSALVQSLAAVIALVITLSLVAVQLAAQSYSARVIDVYKQNPDMWILLGIYILTIFYGLGLIKIIGLGILSNYMEGAIFGAYFMGFFAFICLVPYMWKTLELLKPSTVIKLLANDITPEKIIEVNRKEEQIYEIDPVQPIMDIIYIALEKNDNETVKNGLYAIKNATVDLLKNTKFKIFEEWEATTHIIQHIENIGLQAANRGNEYSMKFALMSLEYIGTESIIHKRYDSSVAVSHSIFSLYQHAQDKKMKLFILKTIGSLENMGSEAAKQKEEEIIERISEILRVIGEKSIDEKHKNAVKMSSTSLKRIGIKAENRKLMHALEKIREDQNKLSNLYQ